MALIFVVSRIIVGYYGISPSTYYMKTHWQNLDLMVLNTGLFQSLYSLHSQPPLWNLILGSFAKLCNGNAACVAEKAWVFNATLTYISSVSIFYVFARFVKARYALLFSIVYILFPSTIFYENYIFYPHLTSTMMILLILSLIKYFQTNRWTYYYSIFFIGILLCMTWTIFHPIFIVLLYFLVLVFRQDRALSRHGVVVFIVALTLSFSPSIKNSLEFGIFSNGSWLGLNLSQVAPTLTPKERKECSFSTFLMKMRDKEGKTQCTTFDYNKCNQYDTSILNNPSIVPISIKCTSMAVRNIVNNPVPYLKGRILAVAHSMSLLPHHYYFMPENWPSQGVFTASVDSVDKKYRLLFISLYSLSIALSIRYVVVYRNSQNTRILVALLVIVTWFLVFSHAFNGGEQQRMRWTIEFIFPLILVISISNFNIIRKRFISNI